MAGATPDPWPRCGDGGERASGGGTALFAVLDAAAVPNLATWLETSELDYRSLLGGAREEALAEAAPASRRFGLAEDLWRAGIPGAQDAAAPPAMSVASGMNVVREPAFAYVVRNPFLSGAARARQLIRVYRTVPQMK